MNAIARDPRPKMVDQKKPGARQLTPADLANAKGLSRALDDMNRRLGLTKPNEMMGPAKLARFAKPLGGAEYPGIWSEYKNGSRRIAVIDMLIASLFCQLRPQDIFPSWKFPMITLVPPVMAMHETMQAPAQQHLLQELLKAFLIASPQGREAILQNAQGFTGFR